MARCLLRGLLARAQGGVAHPPERDRLRVSWHLEISLGKLAREKRNKKVRSRGPPKHLSINTSTQQSFPQTERLLQKWQVPPSLALLSRVWSQSLMHTSVDLPSLHQILSTSPRPYPRPAA